MKLSKTITIILLLLIIIISIGIIAIFKIEKNNKKDIIESKFKEEYEILNNTKSSSGKTYFPIDVKHSDIISYADIKDIEDLFKNKKSGVLYFGFPECPWCRNAITVLLDAASETSLNKIYYMNVLKMRDQKSLDSDNNIVTEEKGTEDYFKLLKLLNSVLPEYILKDSNNNEVKIGEKRLYVPMVIFIKDGEIVGYHADTVDSQTDPYVELNINQKKELKDIYLKLIHKALNDLCDESC